MPEQHDILISLHPRFAKRIIEGSKKVELRRRSPRVRSSTRVWIYEKNPTASVSAFAILGGIEELPPAEAWSRYAGDLGVSKGEFDAYVRGLSTVSALILSHVHHLQSAVSLQTLRTLSDRFHPPQFYLKLCKSGPIVRKLSSEILCGCESCVR